jgi:putative ABC transport system permease protein
VAFFLSIAQVGLLVGWCNTASAIVRHAGVDIWVMAEQTPAFDYGTNIPEHRIYEIRTVPGVAWAQGMFAGWTYWQRPDGSKIVIELIGLDDDCAGGPWAMRDGEVEVVQTPERVIIDELFTGALGVSGVGDEVEILGQRAVIGGISTQVRTFTASPFVFTSLESALSYDGRARGDEVTYVLARTAPGYPPEQVRDAISAQISGVEALTTREFALRTIRYWMFETGIGITVIVTAILGLVIGSVIISQTLYAITNDHLADYATLIAIGLGRRQLIGTILSQALMLGAIGVVLGAIAFAYAAQISASSPIPLETNALIFGGIVALMLGCCVAASVWSVRSVFRIDPVSVFRA